MTAQANSNPSGRNVLVLGASGLIGNAVVRELIQRGHNVSGTCRRPHNTIRNLDGLSMRVVHGDIDTPGCLDAWIEGHDVVVDAAAPYPLHLMYTSEGSEKPTLLYAEKRTDALIRSLQRHDAKLVHVSTLLAQPTDPGTGLSGLQRRMMRVIHPYFLIKSAIEQRLRQAMSKMPGVMIVQPSACLGPYDVKPREQCLVPKLAAGEVSMAISHKMNVIDTRDLANGIAAAIQNGCYGQTLQLTGLNTSVDEMLSEIAIISGVPAPRLRYPAALGVLPSYWAELMWATLGRPSPLPSLLPTLICEQGWMITGDQQQALGIVPRPLNATVRDTIRWYQDLGYC